MAYLGGSDADDVLLLLDLVGPVSLEIDLGADAQVEDGREIEEAAIVAGEDLQLGDDVGHDVGWLCGIKLLSSSMILFFCFCSLGEISFFLYVQ